jgi:hypothetical protein
MEFRNDGNLWWQVAEYSYETFMIRIRPKGERLSGSQVVLAYWGNAV